MPSFQITKWCSPSKASYSCGLYNKSNHSNTLSSSNIRYVWTHLPVFYSTRSLNSNIYNVKTLNQYNGIHLQCFKYIHSSISTSSDFPSISSKSSEYRRLLQLSIHKTERKEKQKLIIEGKRILKHLLQKQLQNKQQIVNNTRSNIHNLKLDCVQLLFRKESELDSELIELAQKLNINISSLNSTLFDRLMHSQSPSGYSGEFQFSHTNSVKLIEFQSGGLILDNITDPGNLGTIIRSAVSFGIKQIITIDCVDWYSNKVIQATAGGIANCNLFAFKSRNASENNDEENHEDININKLLELLKKHKAVIYGLVPSSAISIDNLRLNQMHIASQANANLPWIAIGSEAHGLSKELLQLCKEKCTIKMQGDIDSLNAAVAASIASYLFGPLLKQKNS